jgi:hypothetical protein
MTLEVHPSKPAPVRRGGRSKATTPAAGSVEEPSGSSANDLVEPEPVVAPSRGNGRRGKAATTTKSEPTSESIQEDDNDELDILNQPLPQPPKAPVRRGVGARGKATQRGGDSSLADEDLSVGASTTTKAVPKKAPARGKAKATVVEKESLSESEPVAPAKPKAAAKSTRKVAVKEDAEASTSLDAKPRRTTRTKR